MEATNKTILINNNSLWIDIQVLFSACYPFLKIEFRENENGKKKTSSFRIDNSLCIKQLTNIGDTCNIDISSNRTVSQVSVDFKTRLGLNVEVLRKSGNVWNVISLTENWTLENQNAAGEFVCSQMPGPK